MDEKTQDFLEHYGVKGMKWGVVNKEKSKSQKRESKAEKFDKRVAYTEKRITQINKENSNPAISSIKRRQNKKEKANLLEKQVRYKEIAEAKRQGKLTDRQKKAIKGAAIVGGIVAVGTAYALIQSGEGRRLATKGAMFTRGQDNLFPFKTKPKLMADMNLDGIMKDIVPQINPDYGEIGTKMNCRRCTMAYEIRRRGYDVAATRTSNAHGQTNFGLQDAINPSSKTPRATGKVATIVRTINEYNKTPKNDRMDYLAKVASMSKNSIDSDDKALGIFKALRAQPDGSRGEVAVVWGFGGGHSMAYEIIKGNPVVIDTQSGKAYKNFYEIKEAFKDSGGIADAGFTRLDDIYLNSDFLLRWVKNA